MKSLRVLMSLLPMIACMLAYGQVAFPPQSDSFTAKVYSDKNVAKNLAVENVSYAGKSEDGYKFNINGTALASSMETPVYV